MDGCTNALTRECTKPQREACVRIIAFLHSCILAFLSVTAVRAARLADRPTPPRRSEQRRAACPLADRQRGATDTGVRTPPGRQPAAAARPSADARSAVRSARRATRT